MSDGNEGKHNANSLAGLVGRRAIRRILVKGDCCSLRLINMNLDCFAEDVEVFSVEKAPSLLCTDYLDGLRVGYDELTGNLRLARLDAVDHYYLSSQLRLAPLHESNIDLLVMDSYSDMKFSLHRNRESGVKFWLNRDWLRAPEEFDKCYEWLGYSSFAEAVERNIQIIAHVRQRNPGVPVLVLSQPIEYYADLQKRREFGYLGAELERALPDVFWGGYLTSNELVPADMDSCGPGETLHFTGESYRRMLEFACDRSPLKSRLYLARPVPPPAEPALQAAEEGKAALASSPNDEVTAARSGERQAPDRSATQPLTAPGDQQTVNVQDTRIAESPEAPAWQLIANKLIALDGSERVLPEIVEGRIAWFAHGANTIECGPGCKENEANFEKSLAAYVLFEGEPLSKVLGYHAACIDLAGYADYDEFEAKVRPLSKGNKSREARKAASLGYYCKPFSWRQHIPDIVEINHSKEERSGGRMRADYLKSVEEMGGAPQAPIPLTWPSCSYHWGIVLGVFLRVDGHRQGEVPTGEQLLGYISLRRYGNVVLYSQILGHGDHLQNSIMPLLHFEAVRWLLRADNTFAKGLRYLMYGGWESGGEDLRLWKKRVGFLPYFAVGSARARCAATLLDAEGIRVPALASAPPQGSAAASEAVQAQTATEASDSDRLANELDESRVEVPDEVVSSEERTERLTEIRKQANPSTFPMEILSASDRVLSLFAGGFGGRNDLIHLVDAGVRSIACNDLKPDNVVDLQYRYGDLIAEYHAGDAFALVDAYRAAGRSFTTIVADPFTGLMPRVWSDVHRFLAVAERFAVIGASGDCFREIGTSAETLSDWLTNRQLGGWQAMRLVLRNAGLAGGVYWVVLRNG
ncbi:hypothetical protein [Accumulibacter sp.]|uniref:hypothetical protein n=1 Tax=Accumulibacter sp. TaxID=2053492 RepID=UPI0025F19EEB|nr:hypothetical protein [Accumulibacter sp.]MCM8612187.1 hypothetical protein [Accumulibacter sp.]MCM8635860.1 hypothetical protein [Accumulibacter sp.]MCM8639531.1 hypothetical protein [Accumulibacter sp.]